MMLRVATAFSGGFGSVEFALKYLGVKHEIVFACEIEEAQRECYIFNHSMPKEEFAKDITKFDGSKYFGKIDYYHLSPPCQSFSISGNKYGIADDRGGLMYEAIRSICEVQPKMFSVENVKGLLSVNNGEDWKNILYAFKKLRNYTICWGLLNAKEQGSPQNRERVFIVGFRGKCKKFSYPRKVKLEFFLCDILDSNIDKRYYLSDKTISAFKNDEFKNVTRYYFTNELVQVGNIDTRGHNSIWGRVYSINGIASTINAKGGGLGAKTGLYLVDEKINKTSIRRLTPRECARVQGDFKDMFKVGNFSDAKLYEFIGNAMDISTTKRLIEKMIVHLKIANIEEPKKYSLEIPKNKYQKLF